MFLAFTKRSISQPAETPLAALLRDVLLGLLIGAPWILTPFVIAGAVSSSELDPAVTARLPAPTAAQVRSYCAGEAKKWTLPTWRDPTCDQVR